MFMHRNKEVLQRKLRYDINSMIKIYKPYTKVPNNEEQQTVHAKAQTAKVQTANHTLRYQLMKNNKLCMLRHKLLRYVHMNYKLQYGSKFS